MTRVEHCTEAYLRNRIAELEAALSDLFVETIGTIEDGKHYVVRVPVGVTFEKAMSIKEQLEHRFANFPRCTFTIVSGAQIDSIGTIEDSTCGDGAMLAAIDEAVEHVRIQERQQAAVRVNAALHKYLLDGCASPNACRAAVDACRDAS